MPVLPADMYSARNGMSLCLKCPEWQNTETVSSGLSARPAGRRISASIPILGNRKGIHIAYDIKQTTARIF